MKIVCWNVNGLRTLDRPESTLKQKFDAFDADIIAIQEAKISASDARIRTFARVPGYDAFLSLCRTRDGYSGVATYCRQGSDVCVTPIDVGEGFTNSIGNGHPLFSEIDGLSPGLLHQMEQEGRCVITDHEQFVLLNVYVPAVTVEERAEFKYKFCLALQRKIEALQRAGRQVCVVGDLNISHRKIDRAKKLALDMDMKAPTRLWLNRLLTEGGMVDTFRQFHPEKENAFTCWDTKSNARETNYGARIDYILATKDLAESQCLSSDILPEVYGSDHCPVVATFKDEPYLGKGPRDPPSFCAACIPNLSSKQTSIKDYISTSASQSQGEKGTLRLSQAPPQKDRTSAQIKGKLRLMKSSPPKRKRPRSSIRSYFASTTVQSTSTDAEEQSCKEKGEASNQVPLEKLTQSSEESNGDTSSKRPKMSKAWSNILKGPPDPPWCKTHQQKCVLKIVNKKTVNRGRKFFSCPLPDCNVFYWYSDVIAHREKEDRKKG